MKIFKSIKWRLQVWYGLILLAVLAGLGATAYQLEWGRQMRRIDEELQRRVGVIAEALRPPPPRGPHFERKPFASPPPNLTPSWPGGHESAEFHLPPQAAGLFGPNTLNDFYYLIRLRDGQQLASTNQPGRTVMQSIRKLIPASVPPQFTAGEAKPPAPYVVGGYRNIGRPLPSGDFIWVGCSIAPELKELNRTALELTGIGGIILLLGLAGGWWLVGRAIVPIAGISTAAAKISAGDLSQRINVTETQSELGRLAAILNSTFARLESAFAQQQRFAADAAHELRTPVTVMLTQTQTALTRDRSPDEYRQTVEACLRSAQRMRRLIESLLELARLDAGQESMKLMPLDLSQVVRESLQAAGVLAEQRHVKIHSDLSSVKCTGDVERLGQVILNLLTNAIQYNSSGGEVRLKLESQSGLAVLTVADTGTGIAPDDLPRVFERFYRGDKSRTVSNGNAGLGLAISKAIIEAHGGTIEVASQPGQGTTFTVRLPLA